MASDLERGLAESMAPEGGFWQPDHVHVIRDTGYALGLDGLKRGPEKSAIVREVSRSPAHLRNRRALHLPRGEIEAVRHRIQQTTEEFRQLSSVVREDRRWRTARFLERMSDWVTTFATLALDGLVMPWYTISTGSKGSLGQV